MFCSRIPHSVFRIPHLLYPGPQQLLGLDIQRARQIVEHQQLRPAHEHARGGGALHLPAAEAHPALADHRVQPLRGLAHDVVPVPETIEELSPLVNVVARQLFAYHNAKLRGADIDKPRNLAKSVTVE